MENTQHPYLSKRYNANSHGKRASPHPQTRGIAQNDTENALHPRQNRGIGALISSKTLSFDHLHTANNSLPITSTSPVHHQAINRPTQRKRGRHPSSSIGSATLLHLHNRVYLTLHSVWKCDSENCHCLSEHLSNSLNKHKTHRKKFSILLAEDWSIVIVLVELLSKLVCIVCNKSR